MTTDLWSPLIHGELHEASERKRAPANQRARRVGTSTQTDAAYGQGGRIEGRAFCARRLGASVYLESVKRLRGARGHASDQLPRAISNYARGLIWRVVGTTILFRDTLLSCS